MTTPKPPGKPSRSGAADERITRPEPEAPGPNRAGPRAAHAPHSAAGAEGTVSESVAHAVRMGYDVITENIRQGREAAARFRQGEYNMHEVPGDVETALLRAIQLVRELSTTTLDVCERLVREIRPPSPPAGGAAQAPPFWATPGSSSPAASEAADRIRLTVRFTGAGRAEARTSTLERPRRPTPPEEIFATPLQPREPHARAISEVAFLVDMSVAGLVAEIALPEGLAVGVYSGLVFARNDEAPLGALAVEILP